jgi:hypothetical protein
MMETYCTDENDQETDKSLNLISHVEVQRACEGDAHAPVPALESVTKQGLPSTQALADALYGTDENFEKAEPMALEVVSPTMGENDNTLGALSLAFLKSARSGLACKDVSRSRSNTKSMGILQLLSHPIAWIVLLEKPARSSQAKSTTIFVIRIRRHILPDAGQRS